MVNHKEVLPNLLRRNITYYLSKISHNNLHKSIKEQILSLEILLLKKFQN